MNYFNRLNFTINSFVGFINTHSLLLLFNITTRILSHALLIINQASQRYSNNTSNNSKKMVCLILNFTQMALLFTTQHSYVALLSLAYKLHKILNTLIFLLVSIIGLLHLVL